MRRTLPEQIAANKRASNLWAALLVLLLTALGTCIVGSYEPKYWIYGAIGSLALALGAMLIAVYGGSKIVLSMQGARPATEDEDRMLRNVVEEMAIASGLPMPQIYVIEDDSPNAFATGRDPKNGIVAITTGLMRKLNRDELQGVMAHEMAHIRNYDIRFMTVIAMVAGLIPLLADAFLRMQWFGGGRRRNSESEGNQLQAVFMIIGIILAILAPIFAKLLEMAVSRQREFLADATAAEMTRYPAGLASALHKIENDNDPLEVANRAVQHMYIVNPLRLHGGSDIFSTHPSTAERIKRLMGGAGNPQDPLAGWEPGQQIRA